MVIPVIDLFSGPGGLGEGFAGLNDSRAFNIVVSAEMNPAAHKTLRLRSYFRMLRASGHGMTAYYDFCHEDGRTPWNSPATRALWEVAGKEALNITLGTPEGDIQLDQALESKLKLGSHCVLIGGPPCQAYSLVGRSRNSGKADYRPEDDHRHFLYREYLRVLQKVRPAAFVMENVKGILSSKVGGRQIFHDILTDLVDPDAALCGKPGTLQSCYRIYSLVAATPPYSRHSRIEDIDPRNFVVRAEDFGIPQARHRVILLGIREDIPANPAVLPRQTDPMVTVRDAMADLPPLRSRLSRSTNDKGKWAGVVAAHLASLAKAVAKRKGFTQLSAALAANASMNRQDLEPGNERLVARPDRSASGAYARLLRDDNLRVVLNHEARGHMSSDLRRYAYAATFAEVFGHSPHGHEEFNLPGLAPDHANWKSGHFADRFRVQRYDAPATTVTSHISKDGHYFIHPDPRQCRSLTVREAARLQTFPDNYFFQGSRTEQYHQVGNAVPPLLAARIAEVVRDLLYERS